MKGGQGIGQLVQLLLAGAKHRHQTRQNEHHHQQFRQGNAPQADPEIDIPRHQYRARPLKQLARAARYQCKALLVAAQIRGRRAKAVQLRGLASQNFCKLQRA